MSLRKWTVKLTLLISLFSVQCNSDPQKVIGKVVAYLSDTRRSTNLLKDFLTSGSMNGAFTTDEVQAVFDHLLSAFPHLVSKEKIGQSVLEKDIFAYTLSSTKTAEISHKKSKVLFTGAHHAREVLTPTIVLRIYVEALHSLVHPNNDMSYWRFNELIIVPIVNIDSHMLISKSFNDQAKSANLMRRKNMRPGCSNEEFSGVDLNRNYGYHYGESTEDLDSCSETFRGETAFSEPETQAVRTLVEKNTGLISSAMNFHCYGNLWIHPFNYMREVNSWPDRYDPRIIDFYNKFDEQIRPITTGKVGTAMETVGYFTDGEASDWMLGEHKIVAFSPELGSKNLAAQDFYIPKNLIMEVIEENFGVIDLFLKMNTFRLDKFNFGFNNEGELVLTFSNKGLTTLYDPIFTFTIDNPELLDSIVKIIVKNQEDLPQEIKFTKDANELSFSVPTINRFSDFSVVVGFGEKDVENTMFSIDMRLSLAWNEHISTLKIRHDGRRISALLVYSAFILGTIFAITSLVLLCQQNSIKRKLRESRIARNSDLRRSGLTLPLENQYNNQTDPNAVNVI